MNLYDLHDKPEQLHRHADADKEVAPHFWDNYGTTRQITSNMKNLKDRENAIAKSTKHSFLYAQDFLRAPFPKGEDAIAKDPHRAQLYAQRILKAPFPKGENAIAKNAFTSLDYAHDVLKGPFPKGEKIMATDPVIALHYATVVIKKPFPAGEAAIIKSDSVTKSYLKEFPERKDAIEKLKSSN